MFKGLLYPIKYWLKGFESSDNQVRDEIIKALNVGDTERAIMLAQMRLEYLGNPIGGII